MAYVELGLLNCIHVHWKNEQVSWWESTSGWPVWMMNGIKLQIKEGCDGVSLYCCNVYANRTFIQLSYWLLCEVSPCRAVLDCNCERNAARCTSLFPDLERPPCFETGGSCPTSVTGMRAILHVWAESVFISVEELFSILVNLQNLSIPTALWFCFPEGIWRRGRKDAFLHFLLREGKTLLHTSGIEFLWQNE